MRRAPAFQSPTYANLDWSKFAALVLAPGVPLTHPSPHWSVGLARAMAVEVIGDIELFCRERRAHAPHAPFVAITGTNGKSTTTALIAHLCASAGFETQLGGNIGTAILSLAPPQPGRIHVIECSSFQIDLAPSIDPSVGVLLNVTEDHLDRHGTLAQYAAVKERLIAGVQRDGAAIVGVDDNWCQAIADRAERVGSRVIARVGAPAARLRHLCGGGTRFAGDRGDRARDRADWRHRLAARTAQCAKRRLRDGRALALGLDPKAIQAGLRSFPGLAHRMEEVGRRDKVLFINDSKATNADSAAQALACFSDIFWIAGGKAKPAASRWPIFSRASARPIWSARPRRISPPRSDGKVPTRHLPRRSIAVAEAARDAEASGLADPVVLLSPACASFDQFANFEHRGNAFRDLVRAARRHAGGVRGLTASRTRCSVLHAAPQSRDPYFRRQAWAPDQQRTARALRCIRGTGISSRSKHFEIINLLETIMGDQWADLWALGNGHALP